MTNVQGRSAKGIMLRSVKGVHRKRAGAAALAETFDDTFEIKLEIDSVDVYDAGGLVLLTTIASSAITRVVFHEGIKALFEQTFQEETRYGTCRPQMVAESPPTAFALDRDDTDASHPGWVVGFSAGPSNLGVVSTGSDFAQLEFDGPTTAEAINISAREATGEIVRGVSLRHTTTQRILFALYWDASENPPFAAPPNDSLVYVVFGRLIVTAL